MRGKAKAKKEKVKLDKALAELTSGYSREHEAKPSREASREERTKPFKATPNLKILRKLLLILIINLFMIHQSLSLNL